MNVCHFCGKGAMAGRSHRHRHSAWTQRAPKTLRWFAPNLQVTHVATGGKSGMSEANPTGKPLMKKVVACAKCLKAGKSLRGV